MADSTITVQGVLLKDNWPGRAVSPPLDYRDMTSAAVGHNVVSPAFKLGTKWQMYCNGNAASLGVAYNEGWTTFIYLRCADDINTTDTLSATEIVVPDDTMAAGDAATKLYTVTNDNADTTHEGDGLMAVAISPMTNSYYGWFWCEGVCPVEYVTTITTASVLQTDGSVTAGCALTTAAITGTNNRGTIGLKKAATTAQALHVGIALYADGA